MSKQTDEAKVHGGLNRPMPGGGNSGVKTEDLRNPDEALADTELLTSVEDRLANLRSITVEPRGKPAVEEPEGDEDEPAEPKQTKAGEEEPSKPASPTLDKKDGADDDPVLPDAYVRAAAAYGWKTEDVIQSFKDDPERMLGVLSNIYNTRNKASAEFAALGRKHAADVAAKEIVTTPKPVFQSIDTKGMRDKYGDDAGPLIDAIEAQNKMLQQLVEIVPVAKKPVESQYQTFDSVVEESGIEQQLYAFFDSDSMKPYEKVYGKLGIGESFSDLAQGQHENRWKVLKYADQIAGGAKLQGVDLPLPEALEMAHLLVTQRYRDQILIEGIKGKVVKRSKSISLKPTDGKKRDSTGDQPGPRTREQLVSDVQGKLDKVFNGG